MKRENFYEIFFGFLFIFIDFTFDFTSDGINLISGFDIFYRIDLIPDFVGYFFIASGLSELSLLSLRFKNAKTLAIILFFWSIYTEFSIFSFYNSVVFNIENFTNLSSLLSLKEKHWFFSFLSFTLIFHIIKFFLLWEIYKGISKTATEPGESGNQKLAKITKKRRNLYGIEGLLDSGAFVSIYGLAFIYFLGIFTPFIPIEPYPSNFFISFLQ